MKLCSLLPRSTPAKHDEQFLCSLYHWILELDAEEDNGTDQDLEKRAWEGKVVGQLLKYVIDYCKEETNSLVYSRAANPTWSLMRDLLIIPFPSKTMETDVPGGLQSSASTLVLSGEQGWASDL